MSFKIPTVKEMEKSRGDKACEIPPLFKTARASDKTTNQTSSVTTQKSSAPSSTPITGPKRTTRTSSSSTIPVIDSSLKPAADALSVANELKTTASHSSSAPPVVTNSLTTAAAAPERAASTSGVVIRPVVPSTVADSDTVRQPKANSIIVSPRQRGNPILKFVRNVPWEFGDIVPDYQLGVTSCALYLSLKYHNLKPDYIHERLRQLANSFVLRVLLVQVDVKDCDHALKELAKICILADCTMVLAFTIEEAGRYLETYKSFENKPPDMIMEKTDKNYLAQVTETLTSVKKVNKTDAVTLLTAFGSFKKIVEASEQDLSLCPGLGPQKASRIHKVFNQPFLKDGKPVSKQQAQESYVAS